MVKVFFSTNKWISPSDYPGDGFFVHLDTLDQDVIGEMGDFWVPAPQNIPPGDYYVGAYIDPNGDFPGEQSTYNNAVRIGVVGSLNDKMTVLAAHECP